jgi:hypothetical protein
MSKTKSVERSERPLVKTVLAKLTQIGEPTRSIYAERLRELKPNAQEALQLLSGWEDKRAELALTQPLSEREPNNPTLTLSSSMSPFTFEDLTQGICSAATGIGKRADGAGRSSTN